MELFIDVARYLITEDTDGLQTLRYVFTPTAESTQEPFRASYQPALPSWVPDWRQKIYLESAFSNFMKTVNDGLPLYTPLPGPVSVRVEGQQLHVDGVVMRDMEIASMTGIWDDYDRSWQTPLTWYKEFLAKFGPYPAMDVAIRRSMVGNRTYLMDDPHEAQYKYKRGGVLDWKTIEATKSVPDPSSTERPAYMFANFWDVCYGRRLAVLSGRRIAVVPAGAKLGDKIAAFRGGHSMYLFRLLPERDEYQFIGECYVDGWMDGQLVNEVGLDKVEAITMI